MQADDNRLPIKAALIYIFVVGCWVLLSDELVAVFISNADDRMRVSVIKGWCFVILTGGLLHHLLKRWIKRWKQEANQRLEAEAARHADGEKLRQSEERLRLVLQASADGVWDWNLKSGVAYLSPRYREITGQPAGEVVAELEFFTRFVHPQDWPVVMETMRSHLTGETSQSVVEYRLATEDGTEKWIWGRGQVVERAQDGSPLRMVGTISDITQRKHAEQSLIQSQQRYRDLFEHMNEGFAYCRMIYEDSRPTDFVYLAVNPMFSSLTGLKEVVGKRGTEVIPGIRQTDSDLVDAYGRVAATGKPEKFEHFVESLHLWFDLSVYSTEKDSFVVVFDVITARKNAEAQLRKLSRTVEQSPVAVLITDVKGTIEYVNQAFSKATGYIPSEVVGRNSHLLQSGLTPGEVYQELWATITAGRTWTGELHNRKKNGELFWESATISPLLDPNGKVTHYIAIEEDITKSRQLEMRLRQAQKMEAIGTLAGGIAHDFNNILAAMVGYGELLQQDTMGNPSAQEWVEEILKGASRAKDLVQQILTFSRQREYKRQVIRLDTVIKEAMKFVRASLPAQISIEKNLAEDAPAVLADATQIYQVVMNLATNALHAMEDGSGRLTVSLDSFRPDGTFIRAHPEIGPIHYARLIMADTGHGMDAETLERIFEPFFTTKPVGKGTGLGLSVVHGIVQAHEGIIMVESHPGLGTTVSLYFPAQTNGATLKDTTNHSVPPGQGENILLVDDEPALTAMLQLMLERLGYQITTNNSARDAVRLFQENPRYFDLVISDLTMPEMNGLEVTRQIRAIRPDMPVILASGFAASLTKDSLREAGVAELIEKPVSMTTLANVVQRTLARQRSHSTCK